MYLPFAFLGLSVITGGDLLGDIVGIIAGHTYYYLKDLVPINFRKDYLITPGFVARYLDDPSFFQPAGQVRNNQGNNFGNAYRAQQPQGGNGPNPGNQGGNPGNQGGNPGNTGNRGGFQAFSGRGSTWG